MMSTGNVMEVSNSIVKQSPFVAETPGVFEMLNYISVKEELDDVIEVAVKVLQRATVDGISQIYCKDWFVTDPSDYAFTKT